MIIIIVTSIILIALVAYAANRILSFKTFKICPLCAGVSGTWLWMLAVSALGYWPLEEYQLMLAAMMGGSVVGIAYQIEKRMPESFGMFHKLTQVVLGFIGVYFLVQLRWLEAAIFIILAAVPAVIAWLNREKPHRDDSEVAELEKQMNKCC